MYEDPCKDKNVKFLGEKAPNFILTTFKFCKQNKGNCKDERRRNGP